MKRLILTISIFCISVLLCVLGLSYIKTEKNKYSNMLHSAYQEAKEGNLDSAKNSIAKFQKKWDDSEKYLMLMIHREDLGEIAFSIRAIKEYINAEELPEFYAELNKIMALLDHLWETEVPLPKNFL